MRYEKVTIVLLVFITCNSYAQNNAADSLKQLLRTDIADTTRVLVLEELAKTYVHTIPDTSFLFAQQGIALAKQIKYEKGEADGLRASGNIFWITGNYPKALDHLLQALKKYEFLNDQVGMANAYGNIGNIYSDMGDEKQSILITRKQRIIAESMHNSHLIAITSLNLGDIATGSTTFFPLKVLC